MLFQQAANGVALLKRGVVVGWNWSFLAGYPSSTDIAQNSSGVACAGLALTGSRGAALGPGGGRAAGEADSVVRSP
jgi:hypothetical protein